MAVFTLIDSRVWPLFQWEVDEAVQRARAVLPELFLGAGLAPLAGTYPAEVEAIRLRAAPEPQRRWELEARILARQPPAGIAFGMNMHPDVVAFFEGWFYDTCDNLGIGGSFESDLTDLSRLTDGVPVEIVRKAAAHCGGPAALEGLLRRYERDEVRDSGGVREPAINR